MKKSLKLMCMVFTSIVCFCVLGSYARADQLDCSDKLFACYYVVQEGTGASMRKYGLDCRLTKTGDYKCNLYCVENCSIHGYKLLDSPNSELFINSSGKYSCPLSLKYYFVSNWTDDIRFKNSTNAEDPTYTFDRDATRADYCIAQSSQQDPEVIATACPTVGNNYDRISITSTKNNKTGEFTYSAKYIVAAHGYDIININEVMKKQETKSDGCPKTFRYHTIVSEGNGTYSVLVENPSGEIGSNTMEEYSGFSSRQPESQWATKRTVFITPKNVFKVAMGNNSIECSGSLSNTLPILRDIFKYIRIGAALIFLALTAFDYIKGMVNSDQPEIKKINQRTIKRVVGLIAILILPSIINLVLAIVQISNGSCGIR